MENKRVTLVGVYKITCTPNNKIYIGSSKNIQFRIKTHFNKLELNKHINPHLQYAYNLYGKDNFIFEIIEECEELNLLNREQFWMDSTLCYNKNIGFNNCIKADRPLGYRHTEEAKERMSKLKLGTKQSQETIHKRRLKKIGSKHSEETKRKISNANSGNKNGMFGKKESEEHKQIRMKKLLATPKWNKGLTKKDDVRLEKLAYWKDKITVNALNCKLIDLQNNKEYKADSLNKLSYICPISLASLNRLRSNTAGKKTKERYRLEICK